MKRDKERELAYNRRKVSKINAQLYRLLERRFVLTNQIGKIKRELNIPIEDLVVEDNIKKTLPHGIFDEYVRNILDKVIEESKIQQKRSKFPSIILTGMPGCGKTTIAKNISKELSIPFVDLDQIIESQERMTITEIFEKKGEDYFRKKERLLVKKLSAGCIIALGGGTVLNPVNVEYLKTIGKIVYLKREMRLLKKIDLAERPIAKTKKDLAELYKFRTPIYEEVADYVIDNNRLLELVYEDLKLLIIKLYKKKN